MKEPELPRQTKPKAGIPEKKAQTEGLTLSTNSDPRKQPKRRRKKTSGKSKQRRSHPYDDAFRTLLKTCPPLILPVINEMFEEHYTGKETIDFYSEQQRLNQQDGKGEWRITDAAFTVTETATETVTEAVPKHYLLEVQSTADSSMLVRIFEYSTQTALAAAELTRDALRVTIPHSGILFLRSTRNTPDRMQVCIDTPGGVVAFDVQVLKTKEYTIDEIFEKNLLMLIPFYIFMSASESTHFMRLTSDEWDHDCVFCSHDISHEARFQEYNTKEKKLRELQTEYRDIIDRLKGLKESNKLTEYQYHMLIDMSRNVLEYIAAKYDKVKEGVSEFMGGRIIETEATRIFNEGIQQGETIGETRGKVKTALNLHARGDTPVAIADVLEVDVKQVQKWIRKDSAPTL